MKIPCFEERRSRLETQFTSPHPVEHSGISVEELRRAAESIEATIPSHAIVKAKTFELIAHQGQIAIDPEDLFQDKLLGGSIMAEQRERWHKEIRSTHLAEEYAEVRKAWKEFGAYNAYGDFGHTSPNSRLLLSVGFSGLLERVEKAAGREGLCDRQKDYYESCRIVLKAMMAVARRLAEAIRPYNKENADALDRIAEDAPKTSYEAMQLLILYFFLHEYVGGTRVRTLGRLDVLLDPFYRRDLENGTYTKEEIAEMLKYFLFKFWVAKVPFDLPFCLGGMDTDGKEVTNAVSYLIVETYNKLNIYSPKIHIRVSDNTPADFIKLVLSCIRGGNSSFVFINDRVGISALQRVGISLQDARDFVPIGCYEPAVWGMELGCTGNGGVNLPKAVDLVIHRGRDAATGEPYAPDTGVPATFEEFCRATKTQIAYLADKAATYITKIEKFYGQINPDPILSCQYDHSVESGIDLYDGGAKYNNSSLNFYSIASLTDALCAVKKFVYEEHRFTLFELREILRTNWEGHEKDRIAALRMKEKYGNGNPVADGIAREFSDFCSEILLNRPNGRGGVFKPSLYTIDHRLAIGQRTAATADGRRAGDPLSKNLSPVEGMDRNGITAVIGSVTRIDHAKFPTGSVLDVVLHPTAVSGADGLEAFWSILITYFKKGGYALHGNVFDSAVLRKAQADPLAYRNLQVRVCGWNAYFVNLSKTEQDCFIKQAEMQI